MALIAELKRRNVFKVSAAYLALGWVVMQVTGAVVPVLKLPESVSAIVLWIGVAGFPFVLAFSWIFELTPEGLKRESEIDRTTSITHVTGRKLDYLIVGLLLAAMAMFALDRLFPRTQVTAPAAAESGGEPAAAVAPDDKSIAVLPFVNMSSDKEQEYFSDGISEELLNLLAKVPQLRVIARTSSFAYKGQNAKIDDVARELRVAHVLEGSVRKSGSTVRITAQLVRAADSTHLWSETYDRSLDDIFAVQDEIAAAVVEQLKIQLLGAPPTAKAVDARAYPLILQAEALANQRTVEASIRAIALYQQALAFSPTEARAWTGLARVYQNQVAYGERSSEEGIPLAREAANKALVLDPRDAAAHSRLGLIAAGHDQDFAMAARHFRTAFELEPHDLDVLRDVATFLETLGRIDESVGFGEYLVAHDPANPQGHFRLGRSHYFAGHWDLAITSIRAALALSPEYGGAHGVIADALLHKGATDAVLAEIERERSETWRMIGLPSAFHAVGRKADSDAALAALIAKYEQGAAYNIAYVMAYRHESDRAFEWLDKAVKYRDTGLIQVAVEPYFANLHDDPRWLPFLRKLGRAPEQLAAVQFEVAVPE